MRLYSLLCFVLSICLYNCDGKHLKKDSQKIAVEHFIESTQDLEFVTLVPKQRLKIETDTLLSPQMHIKITTTSDDQNVLKIKHKSSSNQQIIAYQKFDAKVDITNHKKLIYSNIINTQTFSDDSVFWRYAILESVWVNQNKSDNHHVILDVVIKNVYTNTFQYFEIDIDKYGTQRIKPV